MKHGLLPLIAVTFLLCGCSGSKTSDASPPKAAGVKAAKDEVVLSAEQQAAAKIETQVAVLSDRPDVLRVKGRIALPGDRSWSVGVRTVGLVVVVYAGLGDYVRKGQVLARYHADEVREERAHYRAAVAELNRAEASAAQAQRNDDRAQHLLELRAGSIQQVEQAQQELTVAQGAIKRAQIEVDRGRDLLEDDLRVSVDPPGPGQDELLDDVPILAPESGYIIQKNVTPGKTVELSAVTFVIGDLSRLWMLASVRQEDLQRLRVGQSATVAPAGSVGRRESGWRRSTDDPFITLRPVPGDAADVAPEEEAAEEDADRAGAAVPLPWYMRMTERSNRRIPTDIPKTRCSASRPPGADSLLPPPASRRLRRRISGPFSPACELSGRSGSTRSRTDSSCIFRVRPRRWSRTPPRLHALGRGLGAIPHWLYFTPLRVQQNLWTNVVIWLSGVGTIMALLGLIVGISLYSPKGKYRYNGTPTGIPYTGQKRLHMILGLFFGILTCTWAFSGMLSMDPPFLTSAPPPGPGSSGRTRRARWRRYSLRENSGRAPARTVRFCGI